MKLLRVINDDDREISHLKHFLIIEIIAYSIFLSLSYFFGKMMLYSLFKYAASFVIYSLGLFLSLLGEKSLKGFVFFTNLRLLGLLLFFDELVSLLANKVSISLEFYPMLFGLSLYIFIYSKFLIHFRIKLFQ